MASLQCECGCDVANQLNRRRKSKDSVDIDVTFCLGDKEFFPCVLGAYVGHKLKIE